MASLRGSPPALLGFFFAIAVFLTGELYSVAGSAGFGVDPWGTLSVIALISSLGLVLVIVARIFWVTSGHARARNAP